MPNYNITIDSRFDPYSFEDYLKPLAILQEQHNQAEDAYANYLAQSAGMEEALAANPDDVDLLNQYNAYRQTLNNLADDLSKNGISRTTRRGAYQAKADYGNIAKMQEAIKTRDELLKERRGLRAQDNSIIFDTDDDSYSIRNVMAGKTNYNMLSQNTVAKAVADQVQNLAKTAYNIEDNPEIKRKYGYIIETMRKGVMPQEVQDLIEGKPPTTEFGRDMKGILDRAIADATGVGNWNGEQLTSISNYAKRGLWSAIGDLKNEWHQDWLLKEAMDARAKKIKEFPNHDVIWSDVLNAPEGLSILGVDDRQRARVNNLNDFLNGKVDKVDQYMFGDANANANFENWLKEYGGEEYYKDGKFTKLGNKALVTFGKQFGNINQHALTQKENEALSVAKAERGSGTITGQAIGNANARNLANKIFEDYKMDEGTFKDLIGTYADYINKGAVLSEGASYGQISDMDSYLSNLLEYAGDPQNNGRVSLFKGVNKDGYFIEDSSGGGKDFVGDIIDKKTKKLIDPHTRIRLHRDKSGRIVASVTNNSGKAYALDITKLYDKNNKESVDLFNAYAAAQERYKDYINNIPENVIEAAETPKEYRTVEQQNLVDKYTRDIQTLRAMAQAAGSKAFNIAFKKLTAIQDNRRIKDSEEANKI